jgi:hypothetical protein
MEVPVWWRYRIEPFTAKNGNYIFDQVRGLFSRTNKAQRLQYCSPARSNSTSQQAGHARRTRQKFALEHHGASLVHQILSRCLRLIINNTRRNPAPTASS